MALRLAVVGAGARGRDWVAAIRKAASYDLTAWVDLDRQALSDGATRLAVPGERCHLRLDEALATGKPDAVIVATSIDRHAEPCRLAIERGLGVLVEKPFASLAEARALVALADAHRVPLVVGQSYRYTRTPQAVRRLLAAGAVGRVGMVVCQGYRPPSGLSPMLARRPDSLIWETAVHHVDALRFMLADEVTGALAESFAVPWSVFPSGGWLHGLLVFAGGTRAALCATYESVGHERIEGGHELYLRIVGEHGTLHAFQHWLVFWPKARLPRLVWRGRRRSPERTLLDQLAEALGHGREPESSGRENLRTLAVLEAWSRSARERRWVDPRELLDADG